MLGGSEYQVSMIIGMIIGMSMRMRVRVRIRILPLSTATMSILALVLQDNCDPTDIQYVQITEIGPGHLDR